MLTFTDLISGVIDHGFKRGSGQTKDYKIDIFCFSAKRMPLKYKKKDHNEGLDLL